MKTRRYTGNGTNFYVADPRVADMVNLAIDLQRPLLVEGEPGCGKTQLAYSIAAELKLGEPVKISVRSTSRARDLLYRFDALRRLQDAQKREDENARYIHPYLSLGELGRVLHEGKRRVVLIDEIDKADIDFPNDLLDVLDTFTFQVEDLPREEEEMCHKKMGFGRWIRPGRGARPIVVVTSNREKRLPEPFLRRCLFLNLGFPESAGALETIVRYNTGLGPDPLGDELLRTAVESFARVRRIAIQADAQKPPTTSELIDWVKILQWREVTPQALAAALAQPPYWETLFKTVQDLEGYPRAAQAATPAPQQ
jgi:MoxR-like ATPase